MAKIKTDALKEGMAVSIDVKNMDGMLLLPRGCELTERHINILQTWGVNEVEVELTDEEVSASDPLNGIPPEILNALKVELKALFCRPDEADPGFNAVFNAILRRRAIRGRAK